MKIKQIFSGNGYTSSACKRGVYNKDKTYTSIKELLKAVTPKNWSTEDWILIDKNKYQLSNTSVYIITE